MGRGDIMTWNSLKEHMELRLRLEFDADPADELFSASTTLKLRFQFSRIFISRSQIILSHYAIGLVSFLSPPYNGRWGMLEKIRNIWVKIPIGWPSPPPLPPPPSFCFFYSEHPFCFNIYYETTEYRGEWGEVVWYVELLHLRTQPSLETCYC